MDSLSYLTNEELILKYKQTRDLELKKEITLRYIYVVKNVAYQMRNVYVNFTQTDDIIHEGVIAIMNALDRFEPEKNIKFETFISKRIRGMIIDIARKNDWIPRSVRKSVKDIEETYDLLREELGREPTDEEIAKRLDMTPEQYRQALKKLNIQSLISLEMVIEEAENSKATSAFTEKSAEAMPEEAYETKEMRSVLKEALQTLNENEQIILSLYYFKKLSMRNIGYVMSLSEARISQIHARAIKKLRLYLSSNR